MKNRVNKNIGIFFTFTPSKKKPVYNWFYYKEAFSPEVVDFSLEEFGFDIKSVYDPFCGVGTTLLRAKERGLESIGVDISPIALLASRVKTRNYSKEDKEEAEKIFESFDFTSKHYSIDWYFELFPPERAFPPRNFSLLMSLREQVESIEDRRLYEFFLLGLVSILPQVSYVVKDGGVLRINKRKKVMPVKEAFKRKIKKMIAEMDLIKGKEPVVKLCSAKEFFPKADIIITSPPYLNNVDYSKVYGLENSFITLLEGIEKKVRGKALRSFFSLVVRGSEGEIPLVNAYFQDIKELLEKWKKNVKGISLVVGDAYINGKYIDVVGTIEEIAKQLGYETYSILGLRRKAGSIMLKESIIFMIT